MCACMRVCVYALYPSICEIQTRTRVICSAVIDIHIYSIAIDSRV